MEEGDGGGADVAHDDEFSDDLEAVDNVHVSAVTSVELIHVELGEGPGGEEEAADVHCEPPTLEEAREEAREEEEGERGRERAGEGGRGRERAREGGRGRERAREGERA